RRAAGPAAVEGLPPQRAGAPAADPLRGDGKLRPGGGGHRQPACGAGGRHRLRHQPGADRGALPPGGALRRLTRRLRRRPGRQAVAADAGGRVMTAATATGRYAERLAAADWDGVAAELDSYGCALLPQLLTPAECARIAGLYDQPGRFRATIDMARHRFGEGQYRYFAAP